MKVKIGDWIQTSYRGDVAEGYVTKVFPEQMTCIIKVTRCESNKKLQRLDVDFSRIMQLSDIELYLDDLYSLIDLALSTRDKEWFKEIAKIYCHWIKDEQVIDAHF